MKRVVCVFGIAGVLVVFSTAFALGQQPERKAQVFHVAELDAAQARIRDEAKETDGSTGIDLIEGASTHALSLETRTTTDRPHLHPRRTDVFFIKAGSGAMLIGGELLDPKPNASGMALEGSAIRGGERFELTAGDVVSVPANVPHQLMVSPGQSIVYYQFEVVEPKNP